MSFVGPAYGVVVLMYRVDCRWVARGPPTAKVSPLRVELPPRTPVAQKPQITTAIATRVITPTPVAIHGNRAPRRMGPPSGGLPSDVRIPSGRSRDSCSD